VLTKSFLESNKIQIQGSEVVETYEVDYGDDYSFKIYCLEFAKTQKGRRKQLLFLQEEFDGNGQITHISLNVEYTKTATERGQLIDHLMSEVILHQKTKEIFALPFIPNVDSFCISFAYSHKGKKI